MLNLVGMAYFRSLYLFGNLVHFVITLHSVHLHPIYILYDTGDADHFVTPVFTSGVMLSKYFVCLFCLVY